MFPSGGSAPCLVVRGEQQDLSPRHKTNNLMENTKKKITQAVKEYKRIFPDEYEMFLTSFRKKQDTKRDRWAQVKGADVVTRQLIEIPESLHVALDLNLTVEEKDWLYARNDYQSNWSGMKWFMERFPEFKLTADY